MRFRPTQALSILLVLAAAVPPSGMAATWLDLGRLHAADAGAAKVLQVRGRNRVPAPARAVFCGVESRLGSGDPAGGSRRPLASEHRRDHRRLARTPAAVSVSPALRALAFRLRC